MFLHTDTRVYVLIPLFLTHTDTHDFARRGRNEKKSMSSTRAALEVEGSQGRGLTPAEAAQAALDLKVARRLFYGGFAALPWLWFVNWVHFRAISKTHKADPELRVYVQRSLVGAICGGILFVAWVAYVQLTWRSWGPEWQSLMLVVPEDSEL